jgi:hypothetical protein
MQRHYRAAISRGGQVHPTHPAAHYLGRRKSQHRGSESGLGDAELVTLRIQHHHMVEAFLIVLLAHHDRPKRDKIVNLRTDQALTLLPIPWPLAGNPDVDVGRFFAVLGSGT